MRELKDRRTVTAKDIATAVSTYCDGISFTWVLTTNHQVFVLCFRGRGLSRKVLL